MTARRVMGLGRQMAAATACRAAFLDGHLGFDGVAIGQTAFAVRRAYTRGR